MSRVRVRALEEKSRKFFAFGGTAEARLPSILAANASMPPRCRVSHTAAVPTRLVLFGVKVLIICFSYVKNCD